MDGQIKQISGLAVFGAIFTAMGWLCALLNSMWCKTVGYEWAYDLSCRLPSWFAFAGALMAILSLFFIWKKRYKGKWLAILTIIFGLFGWIALVCL